MKSILATLLLIAVISFVQPAQAQVKLNVNLNIGTQPSWGPVGYDYVDYYYIPEIDIWYNVPQRQYIYFDAGRWVFSASIPARYRGFDFYGGYKVVVNEPKPYLRADVYRVKYKGYKGPKQIVIRDSKEPKYLNRHDNGNHYGEGKGKHKGKGRD